MCVGSTPLLSLLLPPLIIAQEVTCQAFEDERRANTTTPNPNKTILPVVFKMQGAATHSSEEPNHRVLQGAAHRGSQFWFIFAVLRALFCAAK